MTAQEMKDMTKNGAKKTRGFFAEFRDFAMKGSFIDMAVGVVIGMALKGIVDALVNGIIMPFVGIFLGGVNLSNKAVDLGGGNMLAYGTLIQSVVSFVIIAFVIFLIIKAIAALRRKPEPEEKAAPAPEVELLTEIRDLLKEQKA
ncbi:MAG: large conductance mechanosensitive channel protein MscL [Clostridiales bacterium]|nr:large conductance mechanosensitive channel protein MscL [Clostridiales bacterium]